MATWAVFGAGSWGTALALVLARNGHSVRLWGHNAEHVARLREARENARFLPGVALPAKIEPVAELDAACEADEWLVVVPSHGFRDLLAQLAQRLGSRRHLAWATKGLDAASGGLLHNVAAEIVPGIVSGVISGPSFAREVGAGLPTAVTAASADAEYAQTLAAAFHSEQFRVYTSPDIAGVELGGSVKNVMAIATGVSDGLGLGANARAALVTRGLAEILRLGEALQVDARTLMGLSGMGDLILTCTDDQSRNRRMGLALGRGKTIAEAQAEIGQTVEGLRTAGEVHLLARSLGVEMPICEQVYCLLQGDVDARDSAQALMLRSQKPEF